MDDKTNSSIKQADSSNKFNMNKNNLKYFFFILLLVIISFLVLIFRYKYFNISRSETISYGPQGHNRVDDYNYRYINFFGSNRKLAQVSYLVEIINEHNNNSHEIDKYGGKIIIQGENIVTIDENGDYLTNGKNAKATGFYKIYPSLYDDDGFIIGIAIEYSPTRTED